jgi:hypothetical protein
VVRTLKQHLATDLQGMDLAAMRAELLELNPKGLSAGKHSKALKKLKKEAIEEQLRALYVEEAEAAATKRADVAAAVAAAAVAAAEEEKADVAGAAASAATAVDVSEDEGPGATAEQVAKLALRRRAGSDEGHLSFSHRSSLVWRVTI